MNDNENDEMATLQTCGVCGTLCNVDEVSDHVCLKGYGCYINKAERYFYPLLDDGRTYLCRVYIDGVEKVVQTDIDTTFNQNILTSKRKASKKSKKLSLEEENNLILAVQCRRPLWDSNQPVSEKSRKIRKRLWKEVADELNGVLDAAAVQQKFKSLRDTYRKIIQSEQYFPSGSRRNKNDGDCYKWRHYNAMEFLRDTSLSKDTSSNIPSLENELSNNSMDQSTSQVQSPIHIDSPDASSSSTLTSRKKSKLDSNSIINDRVATFTDPLDKLIQVIDRWEKTLNVAPVNTSNPFDAVDHMLQTAALQLRKMSPELQMQTLQDIVQMTFSRLQEEMKNN
ncbi:PREDICTED: uncharacterized protein LOC105558262 isoform X2 [Vollenhovia emeryi]|uniref:uncharacterized protein LOC105558262 isoform X2 n=1 Tax=Vollenhovia emeryi TaxID=411798 RepID=UPI0005F4B73C|nr:PREDICTED: uncharacterized protein LOC105558262 isoform X2 [Vollenhovia emeryi]